MATGFDQRQVVGSVGEGGRACLEKLRSRVDCGGVTHDEIERPLLTDFAFAAACRDLTFFQFLIVARCVRELVKATSSGRFETERIRGWLSSSPSMRLTGTMAAVDHICADPMTVRRLDERKLAKAVGCHPDTLGRILHQQFGGGFWLWRSAAVLKPSVPDVVLGCEQFAQLAYRAGYGHPSQLGRDCRRVFALTPTEFRTIVPPDRKLLSESV
jgi:AraC-like DNA-binding protein